MHQHIDKLPADVSAAHIVSRPYAWLVFALTFGLLLSDYMSRQVLGAIFPLLKAAWSLSDTRLGSLSGVVALMVGVLAFPLSVLADRWGRVRSVILMAALWSFATLGCAISHNYGEMLLARTFVGVGEAAYGSVGLAIVLGIFPPSLRATLSGAVMAGSIFGSMAGMALGGMVATHFGWRSSFGVMAAFGIVLVVAYWLSVTEKRLLGTSDLSVAGAMTKSVRVPNFGMLLKRMASTVSVICACIGSALQLFIMGAVLAWLPSFLNRYYGLAPGKAAIGGALFLLLSGIGMIMCGIITDRVSRGRPIKKWTSAIVYSLSSFVLLLVGFHLHAGPAQLVMIGAGFFFVASTNGPVIAMIARLTPEAIHASAFGALTLVNNLIGLAPGPLVTGMLSDRFGLLGALQIIPFAALLGAVAFLIGKRNYIDDL